VGSIQHQGRCHPAAVVAAGGVAARLAAHCKILQIQHQRLLSLPLLLPAT
jgi:hypothetical protein